MMEVLWSMPPHTLGLVNPACCATSTYWTGEAAAATSALVHFHNGVVRASVSWLPRMNKDDPRKRLRGNFIDCDDYRRGCFKGSCLPVTTRTSAVVACSPCSSVAPRQEWLPAPGQAPAQC